MLLGKPLIGEKLPDMQIDRTTPHLRALLFVAGLLITAMGMAGEQTLQVTGSNTSLSADSGKSALENPYAILVRLAFKVKSADGGPNNYVEAAQFYCRAARSGNANALYALGWLYFNGRGVSQDPHVASELLRQAAVQGHTQAQELLASINADATTPEMPACLQPDPPPPVVQVENAITDKTEALFNRQKRIYELVEKLAAKYDIDKNLAMTFIAIESGFNPQATSPKNAQGLMQLIPDTAKRFRVKDAYNPEDNIKGGLAYLQWLLAYFRGDIELVAAAYNAGERAVERHKGIPPYPETQDYVRKIKSLYRHPSHPYRDDLVEQSSMLTQY